MTVTGDSVRIVKLIGAPVDRVYQAFVDPDELVRWMHPDPFRGVSATNDPRVGGRGELSHRDVDGEDVVGGFIWEYLEVEQNRKLVMDWQFGPAATPATLARKEARSVHHATARPARASAGSTAGVTYTARADKAHRELGWHSRPLEEGLRETLAHQMSELGLAPPS